MSRGLCAYAITRDHTPDPAGPVDVRLIRHAGLALVVAEVDLEQFADLETRRWKVAPNEDDPLIMLARRHDVVVRAVFERHPVLPLRFGTTMPDDAAALRLLADHNEEARAWFTRVEGHREWAVRARLPHPGKPTELPAEETPGVDYLAVRRDRLAAAARTRRDGSAAANALHHALTQRAEDTVRRPRMSAVPLLDAAYLVRTETEAAFKAETECHKELAVEVTGPWPPYSFVRLRLPEVVAH
jgi:gas vesicle protein GvpL/GvpF